MNERITSIHRQTKETDIHLTINLDGTGQAEVSTGVGFLDHMLTALAVHGLFDLTVQAVGDLHIDSHHTIEDVGIVLGQALDKAVGDRSGIQRMGHAYVPMDEALGFVAVDICGRVDNTDMPALYARADCVLNASRVDNMPISLLEALASGVPVVSTAAGGIPDMVEHGVHALLVPVGDHEALARQAERVLADRDLAEALVRCGAAEAERYAWPRVRAQWLAAYRRAAGQPHRLMEGAP